MRIARPPRRVLDLKVGFGKCGHARQQPIIHIREPRDVNRMVGGDLLRREFRAIKADGIDFAIPRVAVAGSGPVADHDLSVACVPGVFESAATHSGPVTVNCIHDVALGVGGGHGTQGCRVEGPCNVFRGRAAVEVALRPAAVEDDELLVSAAVEENASAVRRHLVEDLDRPVGGRGGCALRRPLADFQCGAASHPALAREQGEIAIPNEILPHARVRHMKADTCVVDAVPLRDKPILKISFARVRVARCRHCGKRRRKHHAHGGKTHRMAHIHRHITLFLSCLRVAGWNRQSPTLVLMAQIIPQFPAKQNPSPKCHRPSEASPVRRQDTGPMAPP